MQAERIRGRLAAGALALVALLCASFAIAVRPALAKKPAQVHAWGWEWQGILGDGKQGKFKAATHAPLALSSLGGVAQISHSASREGQLVIGGLALLDNGLVMAWGEGGHGELGNGGTEGSASPVLVEGLDEVTSIAAGEAMLALRTDGTVMAWGANESGEVGDGTTTDKLSPVPVEGLSGVVAISAYGDHSNGLTGVGTGITTYAAHSLAVRSDGTVWEWGRAYPRGLLGWPIDDTPVQVPGISNAVAVAAGEESAAALLANGEVLTWGEYAAGTLGNGWKIEQGGEESIPPPREPQRVCAVGTKGACPHGPYLTGVTSIAAGRDFVLATLEEGTAVAWGANRYGQLGTGTNEGPEPCTSPFDSCSATPVPVSGLDAVRSVAAGEQHGLAALADGAVASWGHNDHRQLGTGSEEFSGLPQIVPGLSGIEGVGAGGADSYAFASPQPVVTKSKPAKGSAGTLVKIEGLNLLTATEVHFGSTAATFTLTSSTTIEATAPALAPGTYDVTVTNPSGISAPSAKAEFTVK